MKKALLLLSFLCSLCCAYDEIKINSNVTALKLDQNTLYIGTDEGEVLSLSLEDKKLTKLFSLEKIENYYGYSSARIYTIDSFKDSLLILSEGSFGTKNLSLFENKNLKTQKLKFDGVNKAFFVDENNYLLGLIGSDIKLLNANLEPMKDFVFSHSSLNAMSLSDDRTLLLAGFESGEVELFDLKNWILRKNFNSIHKDNVYQVDLKNEAIISCSTDRRIGIVKNSEEKFLQKDFLIYACALSPNGKIAAFSDNNQNIIELFDTDTLKNLGSFSNENVSVEFIIFVDERNLIFSGFGDRIIFKHLDFKESK